MITAKEHLLENLQIAYQTLISENELIFHNNPEIVLEHAFCGLILKLSDHVLSEKLDEKTFTETKTLYRTKPKTWWDMFKIQYSGRWWMKWFGPPKEDIIVEDVTLTVTVQPRLLFPESIMSINPALGKPVRYLEYEETME